MTKNQATKVNSIIAFVVLAFLIFAGALVALALTKKIFRPTINMKGGTSLVYKIDTQKLTEEQKKGLSQKMISVLRKRIDPDNTYNLVWLPKGDTRFELQIPLPGKKIHQKWMNYEKAFNELTSENIELDEITWILLKPAKERKKDFTKLADGSAQKLKILQNFSTAYDRYLPFMVLYDPNQDRYNQESFQQLIKRNGILEFRVLPTEGHPKVDMNQMFDYVERLREKGPEYASDNNYIWCEIENFNEWRAVDYKMRDSITAEFDGRYYVLASNKDGETMLYKPGKSVWRLKKAELTTDAMGLGAINFLLDEKGGELFVNLTGNNIDRPLCILFDGIAMSAPVISNKIRRGGMITGILTQTELQYMTNILNAGRLPARLIKEPISITKIGEK